MPKCPTIEDLLGYAVGHQFLSMYVFMSALQAALVSDEGLLTFLYWSS